MIIRQPIELIGATGKHDISAKVDGGGLTGQAGAVRLGIARALIKMDADLRSKLKKEGFLTRDPERDGEEEIRPQRRKETFPVLEEIIYCLERKLWIYKAYGPVLKTGLFFC